MNNILIMIFAAIAAVFDLRFRCIPNGLILCMLGTWVILLAYNLTADAGFEADRMLDSVLGLVAGGGIFLAVHLISRKGLGGGDVKFMTAAGLYLGLAGVLPAILFASVLAALTGGVLIVLKKITRKDKVPLAPFLFAGIAITVFM